MAIARALITKPSILLADEPTGNLDTRTSIEVMGIFQRLNRERGITVLVITHEHDIAEYGTRIIACRDGQIIKDQPVDPPPVRRGRAESPARGGPSLTRPAPPASPAPPALSRPRSTFGSLNPSNWVFEKTCPLLL